MSQIFPLFANIIQQCELTNNFFNSFFRNFKIAFNKFNANKSSIIKN